MTIGRDDNLHTSWCQNSFCNRCKMCDGSAGRLAVETPSFTCAVVIMPGTTALTAGWARINLRAACGSVLVVSPTIALTVSTFYRSSRNCSEDQSLRWSLSANFVSNVSCPDSRPEASGCRTIIPTPLDCAAGSTVSAID